MDLVRAARSSGLRIRDDLGRPDRTAEYAALLAAARTAGYELIPLSEFHRRAAAGVPRGQPWLVLRHDVDTRDVAGNEAFFGIERALGARSTFYFRRSTAAVHGGLIRRLLAGGFEVGYHFEEAATCAKRRALRSRSEVLGRREEIEESFRVDCAAFRRLWNPGLDSAASHGDWINRRLAFTNRELVSPRVLAECGLRFEAYGDDLLGQADVYVSDVARPPQRWANGYGLADALADARGPIYLLTHERNWHANPTANVRADLGRSADELHYRLGLALRRGR